DIQNNLENADTIDSMIPDQKKTRTHVCIFCLFSTINCAIRQTAEKTAAPKQETLDSALSFLLKKAFFTLDLLFLSFLGIIFSSCSTFVLFQLVT
ncbi:hypothetical protein DKP78_18130, partial [Enterococcus faecium]